MEGERLISKETAKIAQQKGFNRMHSDFYIDKKKNGDFTSLPCVPQLMLHEWLIRKKIFVDVQPIDSWDEWCFMVLAEDIMSPFYVAVENEGPFRSHQDALEIGLFQGLQLLKE